MPDISREKIDVVNSRDEVIGKSTLREAHEKGILHRAVHIWVFDSASGLFIQQRSKDKLLRPLHRDSPVGEHVKAGETYTEAAIRGLKEELGVSKTKIESLVKKKIVDRVKGRYYNREFIKLFKCTYNGKINFDRRESMAGGFYLLSEIEKAAKSESMLFVPIFVDFFNWYLRKGK